MKWAQRIVWVMLLFLSISSTAMAVSFNETISGDIDAYPSWQLDPGINTFEGTMSVGEVTDLDAISFFVPVGSVATLTLTVNSLSFSDTSIQLGWNLLKQAGGCSGAGINTLCLWGGQFQFLSGAQYSLDQNAVVQSDYFGTPSLSVPATLDNGPYSLGGTAFQLVQGGSGMISAAVLDYRVQIAVAAVPEPETYGMLLAGLVLLGCVTWRRSKMSMDSASRQSI